MVLQALHHLPLLRVRFILQGMKPALTPQQFVDTWADVHLKESAAYVTHFNDLCTLVGHPKPAHMDKTGETFTYQKGARKEQAGEIVGNGFADVWYKDHFAVEYKTARQAGTAIPRSLWSRPRAGGQRTGRAAR